MGGVSLENVFGGSRLERACGGVLARSELRWAFSFLKGFLFSFTSPRELVREFSAGILG